MQKIVLFNEKPLDKYSQHSKIGMMFTNRFAIDEDENSEILKIMEIEAIDTLSSNFEEFSDFEFEEAGKGRSAIHGKYNI